MTTLERTDSLDLSQCMVLIGSFRILDSRIPAECLKAIEDNNSEFQFDPTVHDGTDAWMERTRMPKNNTAYILGSLDMEAAEQAGKGCPTRRIKDICACDFELAADNQTGISRKALSIDLYQQPNDDKRPVVRVRVLSGNVTYAMLEGDSNVGRPPSYKADKGSHFPVPQNGGLVITVAGLEFRMWVPRLTREQETNHRKLAYAFALETYRNPPTYLPSIQVGVDTRHDNMRISAFESDGSAMYLYIGDGRPASNPAKPFFTVWGPPKEMYSAWQPIVEPDSPAAVVEVQVEKLKVYRELGQLLQHPNVYRFHDVAIYAAGDYSNKRDNLPWGIGEPVPDNTETLATVFDLYAAGKTLLTGTQRLSIFQQMCNGMSHAHSCNIAHGKLASNDVLVIPTVATRDRPSTEKASNMAVVQIDSAYTIKVSGFTMSNGTSHEEDLELAKRRDVIALGRLGIRLLAGGKAHLLESSDTEAWIKASIGTDDRVRPLLTGLVHGHLSSENAMHWISGIMIDKPAVSALAKGLELPAKRKRIKSRLAPVNSSKTLRTAQPKINRRGKDGQHVMPGSASRRRGLDNYQTAIYKRQAPIQQRQARQDFNNLEKEDGTSSINRRYASEGEYARQVMHEYVNSNAAAAAVSESSPNDKDGFDPEPEVHLEHGSGMLGHIDADADSHGEGFASSLGTTRTYPRPARTRTARA